ncbi:Uncharacterised protein [Halioglobus japonicus]|nr:Uncharacterised protein [Halioglobus japonicus]
MAATEEQRKAHIALAKAIWHQDAGNSVPSDPKARQDAFQLVKKDLMKRARKLEVLLDRLGYEIAPKS